MSDDLRKMWPRIQQHWQSVFAGSKRSHPPAQGRQDESAATGAALTPEINADAAGDRAKLQIKLEAERQEKAAAARLKQLETFLGAHPFIKARADDRVIVVYCYHAGRLSSLSVAGQNEVTETAEIHIEPGDEPLYLVAVSRVPMIWKVTGCTDRISHFAADAGQGVGVAGINRERTTLTLDGLSRQNFSEDTTSRKTTFDLLSTAIGKPVDGVFGSYMLPYVSIPSMAVPPDDWQPNSKQVQPVDFDIAQLKSTDGATLRAFRRFSPAGIAFLEADAVVASVVAEDYQILPAEAGLLQLMQDGSIVRQAGSYVVQKPIPRFPAGLSGAHAVRFILPEG